MVSTFKIVPVVLFDKQKNVFKTRPQRWFNFYKLADDTQFDKNFVTRMWFQIVGNKVSTAVVIGSIISLLKIICLERLWFVMWRSFILMPLLWQIGFPGNTEIFSIISNEEIIKASRKWNCCVRRFISRKYFLRTANIIFRIIALKSTSLGLPLISCRTS